MLQKSIQTRLVIKFRILLIVKEMLERVENWGLATVSWYNDKTIICQIGYDRVWNKYDKV